MVEVLKSPGFYAHRFVPINRSNYTAGRGGNKPQYVVVHIMDGSYEGSISWAQDGESNVSWHYAVSEGGHTTQQLSENHTAWTNSNWYINQRGISLEHEGYHPRAASAVPKAQLHASAKLVAGICLRHGIPVDRDHIFGHTEIQGVAKPCPSGWPWGEYIRLVEQYAGGKSPSEPVKPVPNTGIKWVNYVRSPGDSWGGKIAAAMNAALTTVGVRGAVTERAAKAAADAREQTGVYTFLIGSDAVERAKKYQKQFTDKEISYNTSGAVQVVTPSYRDRAKWRIADFCEEFKLDKGVAIGAFERAMGKTDDSQGGDNEMSNVEKAMAYGMKLRGAPYAWWRNEQTHLGEGAPAWAVDKKAPDPARVRREGLFCAAVGNLMLRVIGKPVPKLDPYDGGTGSWLKKYRGKWETFSVNTKYPIGTVVFREYRDTGDQGHWATVCDEAQHLLQSYPSGGCDSKWTVRESNGNGYYEYALRAQHWLG